LSGRKSCPKGEAPTSRHQLPSSHQRTTAILTDDIHRSGLEIDEDGTGNVLVACSRNVSITPEGSPDRGRRLTGRLELQGRRVSTLTRQRKRGTDLVEVDVDALQLHVGRSSVPANASSAPLVLDEAQHSLSSVVDACRTQTVSYCTGPDPTKTLRYSPCSSETVYTIVFPSSALGSLHTHPGMTHLPELLTTEYGR
jgi:hypothetical protein